MLYLRSIQSKTMHACVLACVFEYVCACVCACVYKDPCACEWQKVTRAMWSDRLSYLLRADGTCFIGGVASVSAAGSACRVSMAEQQGRRMSMPAGIDRSNGKRGINWVRGGGGGWQRLRNVIYQSLWRLAISSISVEADNYFYANA